MNTRVFKYSLVAILGLLSVASTIKISDMTAATTVGNADLFTIVQGGTNKKVTQATLLTNIFANVTAGSNVTVTNQGTNIIIAASSSSSTSWPPTNSGVSIQKRVFIYTNKVATVSVIPTDNTIPQISEGLGAMTNNFTPVSTNSLILVSVTANFSASAILNVCGAVFDDTNTNAFAAAFVRIDGADVLYQCSMSGTLTNTALTARNFVFNWGPNGATTAYINRGNTAGFTNLFGDVLNTVMIIEEIQR